MAKPAEIPDRFKEVPGAFSLPIKDCIMWFKPIGSGQLVLLQRYRSQLAGLRHRNDEDGYFRLAFDLNVKTLNVIDALFLDPADREQVEEWMLAGEVGLADLLPILTGTRGDTPDDDAEVEVKPRAAKKTTANGRKR